MKNFIFNVVITGILFLAFKDTLNLEIEHLVGMLVLFQPYRIKNNIYSIFGGLNNSDGDIYSLIALFQKADGACISIFGVCIYQEGEECFQLLGITLFRNAYLSEGLKGWSLSIIEKRNNSFVFFEIK